MQIQTSFRMSSTSSGHDVDLESQQTAFLMSDNSSTARRRWNQILLNLRNLISGADKAHDDEKSSPSLDTVSSSTSYYSMISGIDGTGEMVSFLALA